MDELTTEHPDEPAAPSPPRLEAVLGRMLARRWGIVATVAGAGALLWGVVVSVRLAQVPLDWWRWRDDAVITLSHAKNLVDHGTIGVSPGGSRVEGYSSPLQFVLAVVFFFVTGAGYQAFLNLQVVVCVLAIGALMALIPFIVGRRMGLPDRQAAAAGLIASAATLAVVCSSWTTVGWLVSGMENPIATVLGLGVVLMVVRGLTTTRRIVWVGVLLGLLGLARVEFAFFMVPAVLAVLASALHSAIGLARPRVAMLVLGVPGVMWLVAHGARYMYFGSLSPNTARVQNKSLGADQLGVMLTVIAAFVIAAPVLDPQGLGRRRDRLYGPVVLAAGLFVWMFSVRTPGEGLHLPVVLRFTILPAVILAAAMLTWAASRTADPGNAGLVFAGLAWIPVAQYIVLGPARLAAYRVLCSAVPFLVGWAAVASVRLWAHHRLTTTEPATSRGVAVALAMPVLVLMMVAGVDDTPGKLPVVVTPHEEMILDAAEVFRAESLAGGALPIIASPDLGKLSFAKAGMIVDLGRLGDPMMARVRQYGLTTSYLANVAAPDVVEAHGTWSCAFKEWLSSEEFTAGWTPADPAVTDGITGDEECPMDSRFTVWVRTSGEEELALTREIAEAADPVAVIAAATAECAAAGDDVWRCQYVRRAVTRNAAALYDHDRLDAAAAAMAASPSYAMDREIIGQSRGWDERAVEAFVALSNPG